MSFKKREGEGGWINCSEINRNLVCFDVGKYKFSVWRGLRNSISVITTSIYEIQDWWSLIGEEKAISRFKGNFARTKLTYSLVQIGKCKERKKRVSHKIQGERGDYPCYAIHETKVSFYPILFNNFIQQFEIKFIP